MHLYLKQLIFDHAVFCQQKVAHGVDFLGLPIGVQHIPTRLIDEIVFLQLVHIGLEEYFLVDNLLEALILLLFGCLPVDLRAVHGADLAVSKVNKVVSFNDRRHAKVLTIGDV